MSCANEKKSIETIYLSWKGLTWHDMTWLYLTWIDLTWLDMGKFLNTPDLTWLVTWKTANLPSSASAGDWGQIRIAHQKLHNFHINYSLVWRFSSWENDKLRTTLKKFHFLKFCNGRYHLNNSATACEKTMKFLVIIDLIDPYSC
jgi:hypothetical protein